MRYLKIYENFNEPYPICKKYGIEDYTINEDGSIDVNDNVNLYGQDRKTRKDFNFKILEEIPLNFRNVIGNFNCGNNLLTSLKDCPKSVGGVFYCNLNELTSLEFCPKSIGEHFRCDYNKLTSLEFCPTSVRSFTCSDNQITSFKFMPKIEGNFNCNNNNIRDFKYFVEPGGNFYCHINPIFEIWKLFKDKSYIELLNDYDCIRGEDIIIDRLNQFLVEIDKPTVERVERYNNI